ncbi:uncharacterized protein LOC122011415 [Zingiber officinale]|uniref:uncharacterized protein LOC122011415 n=1 Tax=Zingiber officinale TaxID=94328 RepID=UPI001C4B4A0E|nr:uncharacterized protein LOC122011415 [Zingiber officinale]XP_042423750.1 uncharacterized protein LOC122011415 [Zingiber officinale]
MHVCYYAMIVNFSLPSTRILPDLRIGWSCSGFKTLHSTKVIWKSLFLNSEGLSPHQTKRKQGKNTHVARDLPVLLEYNRLLKKTTHVIGLGDETVVNGVEQEAATSTGAPRSARQAFLNCNAPRKFCLAFLVLRMFANGSSIKLWEITENGGQRLSLNISIFIFQVSI